MKATKECDSLDKGEAFIHEGLLQYCALRVNSKDVRECNRSCTGISARLALSRYVWSSFVKYSDWIKGMIDACNE